MIRKLKLACVGLVIISTAAAAGPAYSYGPKENGLGSHQEDCIGPNRHVMPFDFYTLIPCHAAAVE